MKKKDFINLMTILFGVFVIVGILGIGMKNSKPEESVVVNNEADNSAVVYDELDNEEDTEEINVTTQTEDKQNTVNKKEDNKVNTKKENKINKKEEKKESDKAKTTKKPSKSKKKVLKGKNLFIGDSRTVGLMEYGCIKNADFFADSGMSVYNIHKKKISISKVGKVSLDKLLSNKKYDRIYLMMGVNEGGYNFDKTVSKYKVLVKQIVKKQPKARIILQANLHVTKARSDSDKHINNKKINKMNKAISKMADKKKIFYIDANVLFDDKSGNLDKSKTADDAHPYAKYYKQWGQWIINKTSSI